MILHKKCFNLIQSMPKNLFLGKFCLGTPLNFIRFGFRKNLFNCAKINSKSEEIGNRTFTGYWRWLRGNSLWLGHYDITPIEINHLKEKSRTVWRVLDLRIIIIKKRKMIWYIVLILYFSANRPISIIFGQNHAII